ncbi:MAG: tRNA (guanosine(46)-N7)-methyltransferase TrmB [Spirochaetia bacterium]|jgi:tRNA (guanine-N7-)-methyltransferase|nr:tRNA (guanosine(46)-N7)-methyltransferase TrmB [Spirochaetia bacterium]
MKERPKVVFEDIPELQFVEPEADGNRRIHSYVLRTGALHTFQVEAVRKYYSHYCVPYGKQLLDFQEIFGNDRPVIMEIGFGMGQSTARIAKEREQFNYLGVEVFLSGFTKLLATVGDTGIENIRLMRFDAVRILEDMISDGSLAGFHIFFPDPWPKKKHRKRRLIQPDFAALLTRKLRAGGYIYCTTDWQDYADQMLSVFSATKGLHNPYGGFAPTRPWRPTTKYERRGRDLDYEISEVWFEKDQS